MSKPWDPEFIAARKRLINADDPQSFGFSIAHDGTVTVHENGVDRIAEGAEAERYRGFLGAAEPPDPHWWWLSFCDTTKPEGEQFLGVAIVFADDLAGAITESHTRGINPGGEVSAVRIPGAFVPLEEVCNRLLSREDAEALA